MTSIREANKDDLSILYGLYAVIGKKDEGYFEHAFAHGTTVLIVRENDVDCGFCLLNWKPRYNLYRRLNIPEIQDLNVLPDYRRKGIATSLIKWCEKLARAENCAEIGISVGLTKDYGPAQILYFKLGYLPDGNGVTFDREAVSLGKVYPVNDELALMLIKSL